MKKVVTIGGGGGHSQVLKALKGISDVQITGICPSTDSGGSTGILQEYYDGKGYTGDLTKCIVALCNDEILAKALLYRYENGPLHSHSVKNLLYHALEKIGSKEDALRLMWNICGLGNNRILPVTHEKTELHAFLNDGNTIIGETNIDTIAKNPLWNPDAHSISNIFLKPKVKASSEVVKSITRADYIILCPGDLYSSIIPVLLPGGMRSSIRKSHAKIILILNIMTKRGETDNYTVEDFVEKLESYLGKKADHIIYNNAKISTKILLKYSLERKVELSSFAEDPRMVPIPMAVVSSRAQLTSDPEVIQKAIRRIISKK